MFFTLGLQILLHYPLSLGCESDLTTAAIMLFSAYYFQTQGLPGCGIAAVDVFSGPALVVRLLENLIEVLQTLFSQRVP